MRSSLIQALQTAVAHTQPYDLAVVGGGATGLGVALDAALRGYSVVLFDSHDFASGTSSRSTKLLHGGVRYLAQGNVSLVREALAERATVLKLAPHLAQPLPFVMPSYRWWQTPFYGVGLKLYDLLAGRAGLHHTEWLGRDATLAALPGVNAQGLQGGVKYWDGQFDDARLALALARSVEAAGGLPLNYMSVEALQPLAQGEQADGARFVLTVRDKLAPTEPGSTVPPTAATLQVRARAVVNATGVWVDKLRNQASQTAHGQQHAPATSHASMVTPSQGVHVVVDRSFLPGNHALLVPKTQDGRVLFAVPWLGSLILGTTDTPRPDAPREPEPFEAELDFILQEASRVLSRPVQRTDIRSMWVGLRPLVSAPSAPAGEAGEAGQAGQAGHTRGLSREHTIVTDPNGLLTVTGGKWTTYRAMAEDVLRTCFAAGLLPERGTGTTECHQLVGAPVSGPGAGTRSGSQGAQPGLHAAPGLHLYGSEQDAVLALPGAQSGIGLGLTEAMVRFAVRREYACTVEDVLARRWRALFLDARQALAMAPTVAALLAEEHGQDPQLGAFEQMAQRYLPA